MRAALAVASVWGILFAIPFIVYGSASAFFELKPPAGPAWRFLLSVAVTKAGTAVAFVALFLLCREHWLGHWVLYAGIWFLMFAVSEIGDVVKTGYSVVEAALGILSEAIYAPLSAFTLERMFR
jgi:hypothetical protein